MRALRITLITAVVLALSTSVASANLAGSKCKKVNQTKIVADKEYKCLKQGKNKIWRELYVPNQIPYSSLSGAEREVYNLLDQQVTDVKNKISANTSTKINYFTDNSKNPRNTNIQEGSEAAIKVLNSIESNMPEISIYAWESLDWVQERLQKECPLLARQTTSRSGGAAGCGKLFADNLKGWMNTSGPPHATWFEAAHETFHLAQFNWARLSDQTESNWYSKVPDWYREGSGSVFGALVASALSNGTRNYGSTLGFEGSPYKYAICKDAWKTWQETNKPEGFGFFKDCEYGVGRRVMDLLVAKHGGVPALLTLYKEIGTNTDFTTAFEKAHGLTLKAFFTEAEAYLDALGWKK